MTSNGIHENGGSPGPHRPIKMNGRHSPEEQDELPYRIRVSAKFILTSLLASILLSFAVGRAARYMLLEGPRKALLQSYRTLGLRDRPELHEGYVLPPLTVQRGKKLPKTRYTSKNFDTSMSSASSNWLNTERRDDTNSKIAMGGDARQCRVNEQGKETCSSLSSSDSSDDDDDEEQQQQDTAVVDDDGDDNANSKVNPSGEHLMVDIKHVSFAFLNSEQRLAQAMVDLVNEAGLTLLSYHCHGLSPSGVSCVGVLLQNYVSFHTWPVEGVITFDLCVGGNVPLLPVLPAIKRLFGVPRVAGEPGQIMDAPEMRWSHKLRGYRFYPDSYASLFSETDLGKWMLPDLDSNLKEVVSLL